MKNIFCIRHGLAFHNIKAMEIGSDAYLMEECFDAPLVEKGIQQAKDLGNQWKGLNAVQIVFVSPLTRTLQTCEEIFQAYTGVKIIAADRVSSGMFKSAASKYRIKGVMNLINKHRNKP